VPGHLTVWKRWYEFDLVAEGNVTLVVAWLNGKQPLKLIFLKRLTHAPQTER
jgi:hypothetical protein